MAVINSKAVVLISLLGLLLLSSCEEEVAAGNQLTQAERDYLRSRAATQCINSTNKTVEDFVETSTDRMFDFPVGKTWKIVLSKATDGGAATEIDKSYIYVWKNTGTEVFFRYKHTEGSNVSNKYFKLNADINQDMVERIQTLTCNKGLDSSSLTSSTIKATKKEDRVLESADNYLEVSTAYTLSSKYPAFWGDVEKVITKKYFKTNTTTAVTKTEVYTYAVTEESTETDQVTPYTHSNYTDRKYCAINYTTGPIYTFPYDLECPSASNDVTPVDLNTDGSIELNPSIDL